MTRCISVVLMFAAMFGLAETSRAVEYSQVLTDKSNLGFVFRQMNAPMEGNFRHYVSQIKFDPSRPATSSAHIVIDVASIDTGALDSDAEVRGKLWFDTKTFPQASFVSTAIKPIGPNSFEVSGKLTIKGKTLDVSTPLSFHQDGNNGVLEGVFVIKRADFAIGEGIWADYGTVANEVQIKFRLLATAASSKK